MDGVDIEMETMDNGSKLATKVIDDPMVAAKVAKLAPDAKVGSPEAIKAFKNVTSALDFDSSDGKTDKYAGKSLTPGKGGRSNLVVDMVEVGGKSHTEAVGISKGHFVNAIKADPSLAGYDNLGDKIKAWRITNPA